MPEGIGIVAEQLDLLPDEMTRILSFLGYGCLSAPVWFVGIEEGLGKMNSEDASTNLKARANFDKTMDLYEAHTRLREKGRPIDIESEPPSTQVWQYMAKIMLAYNGDKEWGNPKSGRAREYVRFQLGRYNGQTFLTELSPIPAHGASDRQWMELFRERDPDVDSKIGRRREHLQAELKKYCPSLIVCYGLKRADVFAELLDVEWRQISAKIYASHDAKRLLLPFFGNGHMCHKLIQDLLDRGLLRASEPGMSS
jgi:hypothetical protein